MSTIERRYNALGVAAAIALAIIILGYRALQSDAEQLAEMPGGMANHHAQPMPDPTGGQP